MRVFDKLTDSRVWVCPDQFISHFGQRFKRLDRMHQRFAQIDCQDMLGRPRELQPDRELSGIGDCVALQRGKGLRVNVFGVVGQINMMRDAFIIR